MENFLNFVNLENQKHLKTSKRHHIKENLVNIKIRSFTLSFGSPKYALVR